MAKTFNGKNTMLSIDKEFESSRLGKVISKD